MVLRNGSKFKFRPRPLKRKPLPGATQRRKIKKKVVKRIKRAFPIATQPIR